MQPRQRSRSRQIAARVRGSLNTWLEYEPSTPTTTRNRCLLLVLTNRGY
jgi:hypothetical protein